MTMFAFIVGGSVQVLIPEFEDFGGVSAPLSERFAPEFVDQLVPAPGETQVGWIFADGRFSPPLPAVQSAPARVTMRQARLALLGAGLLAQVNATIDGADEATKIEWEYAATVDRASPLVEKLAASLSMGEDRLDALFTEAAAIP